MRGLAFLAIFFALAGCTQPAAEPRDLLVETLTIGQNLGAWHFPDVETQGSLGPDKEIRATVNVTAAFASIGVDLSGILKDDIASLRFQLAAPEGSRVLDLPIANGLADDHGTVRGFFTFDRVVAAAPGNWTVSADNHGAVGQLSFSFWGILVDGVAPQRTFTVNTTRAFVVEAFINGWGSVPTLTIVSPDNRTTALEFDGASDDGRVQPPAMKGAYALRFDSAGWGGTLHLRVRQA